jgi:hypothetical protein
MSTTVKWRNGTAAQHATFTGAMAEITVDTTNQTLRVHDGATAGGVMLAKQSDVDAKSGAVATRTALKALDTTKITVVTLSEAGRQGIFFWFAGNFSTQISADTSEGVYIKANAIASTAGAWVRVVSDALDIRWFGAKVDNSTNDTAACTAAIALASFLGGGTVYFPVGFCRVTSIGNIPPNVSLHGEGRAVSTIRTTSATLDVVSMNGANINIHDLCFDATVARTAGAYINVTVNTSTANIYRVNMLAPFKGIVIPGVALLHLSHIDISNTVATTGISIDISGGFALIFDNIICRNDPAFRPFAHLNITHIEDLMISNSQFISAITDMNMAPGNGQHVALFRCVNTQFDDASGPAIRIAPTGTGIVDEVVIDSPWIKGGSVQDVLITNAGGGTVDTVSVINTLMTGTGIGVDATGVANIKVKNCAIGSHATAISFANVGGGQIHGNVIGPNGLYGANTVGISLSGTTDRVSVIGNNLATNTTPVSYTATGGNNVIEGNTAYPPLGGSAITVGASPFTYTSGPHPETVTINAGTVSLITLGGVGILQSSGHAIPMAPNQTLTITYSAAPSMIKFLTK